MTSNERQLAYYLSVCFFSFQLPVRIRMLLESFLLVRSTEKIGNNNESTYSFFLSTISVHDNSSSCCYFKFFFRTWNSREFSSLISFFSYHALFSLSLPLYFWLESQTRTRRKSPSISTSYSPVILYIFSFLYCEKILFFTLLIH